MKVSDFKRGAKGYIIYCNSKTKPTNITIKEIMVLGCYNDCGYVYDKDELGEFTIATGDVFYNREDAKKYLLSFFSKTHQKFMLEAK